MKADDYFTLIQAAALLKVTPNRLRWAANLRCDGLASDLALAGRLGIVKIGRDWLVPKHTTWAEVDRRLAKR